MHSVNATCVLHMCVPLFTSMSTKSLSHDPPVTIRTSWCSEGGGPRAEVSTAAFRGSFPGLAGLKETKMFFPHPLVKLSNV